MDVLTENVETDPSWAMMFADDLMLCAMTREEVEEDLDTWRVVFERRELKISRTKRDTCRAAQMIQAPVKIVDDELPTVTSFKYLGSLFTSEGGSQADVNFNGKQKTKVVWPLLEAITQPHLIEIAKTIGFWEKEQGPTEKAMEGQHTRRHEDIPTD